MWPKILSRANLALYYPIMVIKWHFTNHTIAQLLHWHSWKIRVKRYFKTSVQVNNCQKLLLLHQITHNMTTDCQLNHQFSTWKFQVQNMLCTQIVFLFWYSEQFMCTTCSVLVIFMPWTGDSMNNILTYCGLVEVKICVSEKGLPVLMF